ncbi:MAG: AAA family ATPase [Acidimicrobiales bacterium]
MTTDQRHVDGSGPGLAWPDHDTGPTPQGLGSVGREEPTTRKPMAGWDRVKFMVLLGGFWLVLVWAAMADDPNLSFSEAVRRHVRSASWLLVLLGAEALRQVHYLISEHSAAYHGFWTRLFARVEQRTGKMNDWTRFRLARVLKLLVLLSVVAVLLGRIYGVSPVQGLFRLPSAIWGALPLIVQVMFFMFLAVIQFVAIFWFLSRGGVETYMPEDIKTRFSDVWGQDQVVERVKENMLFLENPESIEEKGGYVPGGILLWGPPGTGKTLMAEAVAGETGKPYVFVDPGAFTNMFIGVGILKVKALFRKLRKLAVRYGGVIAFFDEADSLGNRGAPVSTRFEAAGEHRQWDRLTACNGLGYTSPETAAMVLRAGMSASTPADLRPGLVSRLIMGAGMGGGGGMGTLQALLTELSGLKKPRGFINRVVRRTLGMRPKPPPKYRMLIMMATNMPQALDDALLRPGRIDRIYKVGYPSKEGRKRTYQGYFDKVRHELTDAQLEKLSVMTPYATGAKIKDLVNESLIVAIREGRSAITWSDVMRAKQLKDLGPPEDVEYIERERHAVAVHEACHAVAAVKVRRHLTIDIATIEKGGTYLGMVASIPPEDQFTRWRSEYEADIMVSLASLAGERIFFSGDNSSGVAGDLESATRVATMMEGYWGMGSTVASHGVTHEVGIGGGGRPGGGEGKEGKDREKELLESGLGQRIEEKLDELLKRVEQLLREYRQAVLAVAHALESNKTLTGEDVVAIVEGHRGPLLDGRPYHTPDFLKLAEQYHSAAVAAHQGHSTIALPLPRWSPNGSAANGSNGLVLSFEAPSDGGDGEVPEAPTGEGPAYVPRPPGAEPAGEEEGADPDYIEEAPPRRPQSRRLRRPRE